MGGWQADIHDRDVRCVAAHLEQQIVGGSALRDDLEAGLGQQPREPLAQENAILGDRYAHGISARRRVPPPAGLQTRNAPPTPSNRSANPRQTNPRSLSAPQTASSMTSTTTI